MNAPTFITLLLLLSACTANAGTQPTADSQAVDTTSTYELPLPEIPSTLRQPAERAAYVMEHFWDALDGMDTTMIRNSKFMEQNFVNFVNLYQHTDSSQWKVPTEKFLKKIGHDPQSRGIVYDLINTYLAEQDSPVHSDDVYIEFLRRWVSMPGIDRYEMIEPEYRLAAALRNRPGTNAADFRFTTASGATTSLYKQPATPTLMLLYDPDCDHCMETIGQLRDNATINSLVSNGKLIVLAVCVEGDRELWNKTKTSMPSGWTIGIDDSGILDNELYDIPEMPGIYLLDGQKKVILRDPSLTDLTEKLGS